MFTKKLSSSEIIAIGVREIVKLSSAATVNENDLIQLQQAPQTGDTSVVNFCLDQFIQNNQMRLSELPTFELIAKHIEIVKRFIDRESLRSFKATSKNR